MDSGCDDMRVFNVFVIMEQEIGQKMPKSFAQDRRINIFFDSVPMEYYTVAPTGLLAALKAQSAEEDKSSQGPCPGVRNVGFTDER